MFQSLKHKTFNEGVWTWSTSCLQVHGDSHWWNAWHHVDGDTEPAVFQLECFTVFVQIKLEENPEWQKKTQNVFSLKKETLKHCLHGWTFCVCVGLFYILYRGTVIALYTDTRAFLQLQTDFRYCLILRCSKRYSDSRFHLQQQHQQVSELNFTLYCFFQFLLL